MGRMCVSNVAGSSARAAGVGCLGSRADPGTIPLVGLELHRLVRLVLRGVGPVDARQADHVAAPAADHEGAERVADGEGGSAEEVPPLDALALQRQLVINL